MDFRFEITDWEKELTVTSLTTPYVSHRVFESNAALHAAVCSAERSMGSDFSRLFAGDVQLLQMTQSMLLTS